MIGVAEIEAALDKLARLVDAHGERFLPFYERLESCLADARVREAGNRSVLARAQGRARDTRYHREIEAMLS